MGNPQVGQCTTHMDYTLEVGTDGIPRAESFRPMNLCDTALCHGSHIGD